MSRRFFESICPTLARISDVVFEIICIDDGSKDDTLTYLLAAAQSDARIKVIELPRNRQVWR